MWLSSCRIVMAPAGLPEKTSRYCEIGASRSTLPASTSCMTASAVKLLEIEPITNAVSGVTSASPPTSTTPRSPAEVTSPSATTAYARPGTPEAGISLVDEVLDRPVGGTSRQGGRETEGKNREKLSHRIAFVGPCACGRLGDPNPPLSGGTTAIAARFP